MNGPEILDTVRRCEMLSFRTKVKTVDTRLGVAKLDWKMLDRLLDFRILKFMINLRGFTEFIKLT